MAGQTLCFNFYVSAEHKIASSSTLLVYSFANTLPSSSIPLQTREPAYLQARQGSRQVHTIQTKLVDRILIDITLPNRRRFALLPLLPTSLELEPTTLRGSSSYISVPRPRFLPGSLSLPGGRWEETPPVRRHWLPRSKTWTRGCRDPPRLAIPEERFHRRTNLLLRHSG